MEKKSKVIILIGIAFLVVGAYFVMLSWSQPSLKSDDLVACTQEAKSCSDGSYVGRTGPNCEFAACPGEDGTERESMDTSDWKIYRNEQYGFEVKYPVDWDIRIEVGGDNIFTFYKTSDSHARIRVSIDREPEDIEQLAEIIARQQIRIDGVSTEKLLGDFYLAEGREWIVQIKRNSFYYFIYGNGYNVEEEKIFDQFLFDFKFIK